MNTHDYHIFMMLAPCFIMYMHSYIWMCIYLCIGMYHVRMYIHACMFAILHA